MLKETAAVLQRIASFDKGTAPSFFSVPDHKPDRSYPVHMSLPKSLQRDGDSFVWQSSAQIYRILQERLFCEIQI
jgi:hypothetical protein